MRKKVFQTVAITFSLFILGGCSNNKVSNEEKKPNSEITQENTNTSQKTQESNTNVNTQGDTKEKSNSGSDQNSNGNQKSTDNKANNRYAVAGINNPIEFETQFNTVKALVTKGNKLEVAKYILYPINVNINGAKTTINKEADFIKNYDSIINTKVKNAFVNQKVENTFVNYQGVMVGNGELWFTESDKVKNKYCIYAINNK